MQQISETKAIYQCGYCGKKIIDFISNRRTKNVFCNRSCHGFYMSDYGTGKKAIRWRKDRKILHSAGYLLERTGKSYRLKHRRIVERSLGRKLTNEEVIHHIDGDKLNNDINNLQVLSRS